MEIYNGLYCVYCHINKVNNKKYFGITKTDVNKRWHNGAGYKTQLKFYRAIQKYGWDGFYHEIIATHLTEKEAKNFEILLIDKFDSINNGYNVSRGGDTGNGITYTKEMRESISKRVSGKGNPRFGVALSEETKRKISESLTGRKMPELTKGKNPMARKVQYGGLVFDSIIECAEYLGYSKDTVQNWLAKKNKPPKRIVDVGLGYYGEEKIKEGYNRKSRHSITVCEGIEYKTAKLCAEYYGINPSTMVKWLNGTNPMPKEWRDKGLRYK